MEDKNDNKERKNSDTFDKNDRILQMLANISKELADLKSENQEVNGRLSILEGEKNMDYEHTRRDTSVNSPLNNEEDRRMTKFQRMVAENNNLSNRYQVQVTKEPPSHKHM